MFENLGQKMFAAAYTENSFNAKLQLLQPQIWKCYLQYSSSKTLAYVVEQISS